mgnify:CR=1 FL=1
MRCRYAPTCRRLRVLNRAQHLIGNKSHRGARSGPTHLQQAAHSPHRCRCHHQKEDSSIRNEAGATSCAHATIAKLKNENSP